jgi:hypothetical protein
MGAILCTPLRTTLLRRLLCLAVRFPFSPALSRRPWLQHTSVAKVMLFPPSPSPGAPQPYDMVGHQWHGSQGVANCLVLCAGGWNCRCMCKSTELAFGQACVSSADFGRTCASCGRIIAHRVAWTLGRMFADTIMHMLLCVSPVAAGVRHPPTAAQCLLPEGGCVRRVCCLLRAHMGDASYCCRRAREGL